MQGGQQCERAEGGAGGQTEATADGDFEGLSADTLLLRPSQMCVSAAADAGEAADTVGDLEDAEGGLEAAASSASELELVQGSQTVVTGTALDDEILQEDLNEQDVSTFGAVCWIAGSVTGMSESYACSSLKLPQPMPT